MEKMTIKYSEGNLDNSDSNDKKYFKETVEPTIESMVDMVNRGVLSKGVFKSIVSSLLCVEEGYMDDYIIQYIEEIGF